MYVSQSDYEVLLAEYSSRQGAIALLKLYRPYLETLPSIRRPEASLITIPLPVVRIRNLKSNSSAPETLRLPGDLAIVMCDPEWKIKLGVEIIVFIHRPEEDFSHLLGRWRQTQVLLDRSYEWLMPPKEQHMLSEAAEQIHPLFVLFDASPPRIEKGLVGAGLPYVVANVPNYDEETEEVYSVSE